MPQDPRLPSVSPLDEWARSGWLLLAGAGLCALGLAAAPQGNTTSGSTTALPLLPTYGTADSNGRLIAVTGPDVTGTGVLYVIDTETKQLACYQAVGGTGTQAGVRLIGARRIDLDLSLLGFNDRSKYTYEDLSALFDRDGANKPELQISDGGSEER